MSYVVFTETHLLIILFFIFFLKSHLLSVNCIVQIIMDSALVL